METNVWATALARWETAHQPTRLRARPLGPEGYDLAEQIYQNIAKDYLGFAWRHTPFARLRLVNLADIWILSENSRLIGYAFARVDSTMLAISNLVLQQGIDAAEAIAAVAAELKSGYVQVKLSRPATLWHRHRSILDLVAGYYLRIVKSTPHYALATLPSLKV